MQTFSLALSHVQRNYVPLLIYAVIGAAFLGATVLIQTIVIDEVDLSGLEQGGRFYPILMGIATAVVFSIAKTIAFLGFAADIERPVWKAHQEDGAFFKFYAFWFTLGLIDVAGLNLIVLSPLEASTRQSLFMMWTVVSACMTPFGACVMFFGNTTRTELGLALHTMITQLPRMVLICFIGLLISGALQGLQLSLESYFLPVLAIVYAYFDCFIFSYCWELCRDQREIEENSDDLDF